MSEEKKIPPEAMGIDWPLTVYVCQQCSRPTLFEKDRCCSGFQAAIRVEPIGLEHEEEHEEWLIEELDLGVRSYNCLKRAGIWTVGDLVKHTAEYVQAIPNMGKKSMDDLLECMERTGLQFAEEDNA